MEWQRLLSAKRIVPSDTANPNDRSQFDRDYDRIIFSKPFRRLQKKTQVFPLPETDFIHTRLTHSLETACVGRSLGMLAGKEVLKQDPNLSKFEITAHDFASIVAAASLAHDIGNPPFGHSGEDAIGEFFKNEEGKKFLNDLPEGQRLDFENFEGNSMGLRQLIYTLPKVSKIPGGLNLTHATIGAYSKYPRESSTVQFPGTLRKKPGIFQGQKEAFKEIADHLGMIKRPEFDKATAYYRHPLAFLVEAADDISYLIMDFEDGFNLKLVTYEEIEKAFTSLLPEEKAGSSKKDFIIDPWQKVTYLRAKAIAELVKQVGEVFARNLDEIMSGKYDIQLATEIRFADQLQSLRDLCFDKVYSYRKVLEIESAGFKVIGGLLNAFISALRDDGKKSQKILQLLPAHYRINRIETSDHWYEAIMQVVQFISGMTDTFAIDTYRVITGIKLPNY
jgi:dGTPase